MDVPHVTLPRSHAFSSRASSRFFHLVDAIALAHEPTSTQLEKLDSAYQSTGKFLSECPEFGADLEQIHAHGSRQLGTIVRPRDTARQGFDIDLIARLSERSYQRYADPSGPTRLLDRLYHALRTYAQRHGLGITRWERCVTLEYADNMSADIAPVIDAPWLPDAVYGHTHGVIPDRALRSFNSTNPRGYAKYFDGIAAISPMFVSMESLAAMDSRHRAEVVPLPEQEVFGRLLCRLVQLLKLHRNVAFGAVQKGVDLAPSSVFITTLAAMAYELEAPKPHASPLSLLLDVVDRMPSLFQRYTLSNDSQEWVLSNPCAPQDNLAEGMNAPGKQEAFFQWHQRLIGDLTGILSAIENRQGADTLHRLVESTFGARSATAIHELQHRQKQTDLSASKVLLVGAGAGGSTTVAARSHTFFGDQ